MSNSPMHDIPGAFQKLQELYLQGNDLMNKGKYAEAADLFSEGINIDDNFRYQYVSQYAMRATCYFETSKYRESIQDYQKALEIEPNVNNKHVDYYFTIGMCYNKLNEYEKALTNLNTAIEMNPQDYEAVLSRGDSYIGLNQLQNALIDYELTIAHLDNLIQEVFDTRDRLRKELGLSPANPLLKELSRKGNKLIDENKIEEAIQVYTEAIALDENYRYNHVTNYAMRGHCYMLLNQHREAIADFEKAISLEPNFKNSHADYYARIAKCYGHGLEEEENAIINYTKSLEINPNNYEAIFFRGYSYLHSDKPKEALADFEFVIEHVKDLDKQTYEIRDTLRAELGLEPVVNSDDPEVFPGESISKLSDYVKFMKKLQTGDMSGALSDYGLDMMQYGAVAQKWGQKLASDQELTAKYAKMITA